MLVIINAMKSISRSLGRNILIGIIVFAIAASSCVALAIRNAANEAEIAAAASWEADEAAAKAEAEEAQAAIKDLLNINGTISLDRRKMMEDARNSANTTGGAPDRGVMRNAMVENQNLSLEKLLDYSKSDLVKDFYYSASISLNATGDLEAYSTESNTNDGNNNGGFPGNMGGGMGGIRAGGPVTIIGGMMMAQGDFSVTGYSTQASMTKFNNGTAALKEGNMLDLSSADKNCLISYELALFNGLSVGDKITLENPNKKDETYSFTIIGIYTDSGSAETGDIPMISTAQDPVNLICISYNALQTITDHSESVAETGKNNMGFDTTTALNAQISHNYVFANHENYESFAAELTEKGLEKYYTLTSSDIRNYTEQIEQIEQIENTLGNYKESLAPIQNLSQFATTLFLIILAVGSLILIVINVFNIRERKYEVGVLTAIGIKKSKVALQFVTELLCVTLIAIIIGAGAGATVSVPIARDLLQEQIAQAEEQNKNNQQPAGAPNIINIPGENGGNRSFRLNESSALINTEPVDYWSNINATFNLLVLAQMLALGIVLTFISSLAAIIFVMRYEPLKILANRA